jgi:hypothetical protein
VIKIDRLALPGDVEEKLDLETNGLAELDDHETRLEAAKKRWKSSGLRKPLREVLSAMAAVCTAGTTRALSPLNGRV